MPSVEEEMLKENAPPAQEVTLFDAPERCTRFPFEQVPVRRRWVSFETWGFVTGETIAGAGTAVEVRIQVFETAGEALPAGST
jgi:hypothetical protein